MPAESRKRIFWKPDQWEKVAKRSFLIRKDPLFNGTDIEAVRMAQREMLHPSLHRRLISMQEVTGGKFDLLEMWRKLNQQGYGNDTG